MAFSLDQHLGGILAHQVNLTQKGALTWGVTKANVTFDEMDRQLQDPTGRKVERRTISCIARASDLPGIAREAAVTLDGVQYKVRAAELLDDGLKLHLLLTVA